MKLSAIEPSDTGQDLRTFTCPACKRVQRHIIESTVTEAWLEPRRRVMYEREMCLVHASICREKAQADPARSDHWIDRAITWHQRAIQARGKVVTYEIHDGRMIPKPTH
jgi:hypothetical protein